MIRVQRRQFLSCLALIAACTGLAAHGQATFGAVTGTVTDAAGAVVPGVSVTATNQATNVSRTVVSGDFGNYEITHLNPGAYQVSAELPGFKRFVRRDVAVAQASTVRINVRLEIGEMAEEVVVEAGTPVVQLEAPTVSQTRVARELRDLPTNIRGLAPIYNWTWVTPTAVQGGGSRRAFGGARASHTNFNVDGLPTQSPSFGNQTAFLDPMQEAIQEVRFEYVGVKAESSQPSNVTTITRSGGNRFHGTAFWYNVHSALSARSFFAPTRGPLDPVTGEELHTQNNQLGFTLGGPIRREKFFFLTSFEYGRNTNPSIVNVNVPTLKMRQGDFSELLALPSPILIRNPFTGEPFPGNQIPSDLLYAGSLAWQNRFYPDPNFGPPDSFIQNFRGSFQSKSQDYQTTNRVDFQLSERQSLYFRMQHLWRDLRSPSIWQGLDRNSTGFTEQYRTGTHLLASNTFSFSPNLINESKFGLARHLSQSGIVQDLNGLELVELVGIQGLVDTESGNRNIPEFSITGFASPSQGFGETLEYSFLVSNDLTWIRGRHTFKMGALLYPNRGTRPQFARFGSYNFQNNRHTGYAYADFLLGLPHQTGVIERRPTVHQNFYHLGAFFQDDFKVTPRLTLNWGVRWDYNSWPTDTFDLLSSFDLSTGSVVIPNEGIRSHVTPRWPAHLPIITAAQAGLPERTLRHPPSRTNFAPRLGFAWRPFSDDRSVIRAGYGIFYDLLTAEVGGANWFNGVFRLSQTFTNRIVDGVPLITLQQPFLGATSPGTVDMTWVNPNLRNAYLQQWNLTVEHDLGFRTGLRISYVGTKATHLLYRRNFNQPPASVERFTPARRPFSEWRQLLMRSDQGGNQSYNALVVNVERRLPAGLHFDTNWTWAKSLTDVDETGGVEHGTFIENSFDRRRERGDTQWTPRHRVIANLMYDLPVGMGQRWLNHSGWLNGVLGGWRVTGNFIGTTGQFLTPSFGGSDPSNTDTFGGRPDRIGDGNLPKSQRTLDRWFDTSAFAVPPAGAGRFGNSAKGVILGPGRWVLNFGLMKGFNLGEQRWVRFQATATNVLNNANFNNPNLSITSTNVGIISSIYDRTDFAGPREIMLGLRMEF